MDVLYKQSFIYTIPCVTESGNGNTSIYLESRGRNHNIALLMVGCLGPPYTVASSIVMTLQEQDHNGRVYMIRGSHAYVVRSDVTHARFSTDVDIEAITLATIHPKYLPNKNRGLFAYKDRQIKKIATSTNRYNRRRSAVAEVLYTCCFYPDFRITQSDPVGEVTVFLVSYVDLFCIFIMQKFYSFY